MCECCARHGLLYATHVRNRDVYYDLGFSEAIATARHAGAKLQISHIQPKYGAAARALCPRGEGAETRRRRAALTSLPADRLGLKNRGRLVTGAPADIVVFDPAKVADRSTMTSPKNHPAGLHHVLLGGIFTLRDGARTDNNPGRVVRRQ